jgi:hypothetical protein
MSLTRVRWQGRAFLVSPAMARVSTTGGHTS